MAFKGCRSLENVKMPNSKISVSDNAFEGCFALENSKNEKENLPNKTKNKVYTTANLDNLKKLKELLDAGIITQEEFETKKKQILDL